MQRNLEGMRTLHSCCCQRHMLSYFCSCMPDLDMRHWSSCGGIPYDCCQGVPDTEVLRNTRRIYSQSSFLVISRHNFILFYCLEFFFHEKLREKKSFNLNMMLHNLLAPWVRWVAWGQIKPHAPGLGSGPSFDFSLPQVLGMGPGAWHLLFSLGLGPNGWEMLPPSLLCVGIGPCGPVLPCFSLHAGIEYVIQHIWPEALHGSENLLVREWCQCSPTAKFLDPWWAPWTKWDGTTGQMWPVGQGLTTVVLRWNWNKAGGDVEISHEMDIISFNQLCFLNI